LYSVAPLGTALSAIKARSNISMMDAYYRIAVFDRRLKGNSGCCGVPAKAKCFKADISTKKRMLLTPCEDSGGVVITGCFLMMLVIGIVQVLLAHDDVELGSC
jgi:hypothetical protein